MRTTSVLFSMVGVAALAACSGADAPEADGETIEAQAADTAEADADGTADADASDAAEPEAAAESAPAAAESVMEGIRAERVSFDAGANSATVEGSITGYDGVDYVLNVREGQPMNISMATDNTSNYFNILEPGATAEAVFVGSTSGNQFEGTAAKSGDYRIRVYLMRNAARREETAEYRLEMIVG